MVRFLAGDYTGVFDEADLRLLCKAFEEAWAAVEKNPSGYFQGGNHDGAKEALASYIVASARAGERDVSRLRTAGLLQLMTELSGSRSHEAADGVD